MVRPRKSLAREYQHKVETGCYVGRAYVDYGKFLSEHPGVGPVYMDLLIGRIGGVCILTLHWPRAGFMTGILIPNKCAESVVAVFDRLYAELGTELFARLFPVILTDRGTEFSFPSRIEECEDGTKRTRVFFCDPMNSNQKSQLERNHEIVREILPKGVSFDSLTQEQADLAFSHVNAYVRGTLDDKTPYEVFEFLYGEGTAAKLHIAKIDQSAFTRPQTRLARWAGGAFVSRGQCALYDMATAECKTGRMGAHVADGVAASRRGGRAVSEERGFAGVGGALHAARG